MRGLTVAHKWGTNILRIDSWREQWAMHGADSDYWVVRAVRAVSVNEKPAMSVWSRRLRL